MSSQTARVCVCACKVASLGIECLKRMGASLFSITRGGLHVLASAALSNGESDLAFGPGARAGTSTKEKIGREGVK